MRIQPTAVTMGESALPDILLLLAATLAVVAGLRRLNLPPILGFLAVGMLLGPHALAWVPDTPATRTLAEFGVVFMLFTLGLEFSLPRMLAMRSEVFGLGGLQVGLTTLVVAVIGWFAGQSVTVAILLGGVVAMSSTAIVLRQLTEQGELNRTHGRLAFGILLFQDMAFVLFLALTTVVVAGQDGHDAREIASALTKAAIALGIVLASGRWLLRPLFHEIGRSGTSELFTLAVLFVAMGSAWATHAVGLSLALGAFLAGMMLAETEYRHQVETGIRPFRDTLLGLFFVTIGMQLDIRLLFEETLLVAALLAGMLVIKTAVVALAARHYAGEWFKSVRTGIVVSMGGEFSFALLAILLHRGLVAREVTQPLLAAIVLSMVVSPLILRHNKAIARFILREKGKSPTAMDRTAAMTDSVAAREHVVLCGFGRVGQNVGRVLEKHGFEFLAMDLDPYRVRTAREAGEAVIFGDSTDEEMLKAAGVEHASAVVVSFANTDQALRIVAAVRRLSATVPVLVRTADDARLEQLLAAGATEVVPETFEASLMIVSHALLLLDVPMSRVVKTLREIRGERYRLLRNVFRREETDPLHTPALMREELKTVTLPPGAWSVGRSIRQVQDRGAEVSFAAVRRADIVGRDPDADMVLREGDVVVVYGTPEALEHAETVLLAG
ncbi:MAG: cation:proton antiporter [Piscinibacter sp.]|nr:cation:proton antiporter [Piscinibacter sp.]